MEDIRGGQNCRIISLMRDVDISQQQPQVKDCKTDFIQIAVMILWPGPIRYLLSVQLFRDEPPGIQSAKDVSSRDWSLYLIWLSHMGWGRELRTRSLGGMTSAESQHRHTSSDLSVWLFIRCFIQAAVTMFSLQWGVRIPGIRMLN